MAAVSATSSLSFRFSTTSSPFSTRMKQLTSRQASSLRMIGGRTNNGFPSSLRTSGFIRISCMAKPETVQKVCEIVRNQLALSAETELTPDCTFASLGADSLDTVEIVMGLEEEFGINVADENSDNITTIKDAAELIEKLVQLEAS
ncbi:hypothetical protein ACH5RR_030896 [Cinchona calisaya]|uniref:Acyl carrier protein n=1 Tax=Cinchona calisaya TaxID=153742 RepID=A0ABD2YZJ9_9GENT